MKFFRFHHKAPKVEEQIFRRRGKSLGLVELVAIALGGMIGGGIFTILGISVSMVGYLTPVAIGIGGFVAFLAAYSYVQLGLYYKDEGATYAMFKRSYPQSHLAASVIGWFTIFGYISTLALYAYTFSSYAISGFAFSDNEWIRKLVAIGIVAVFAGINIWSVKGMGKLEDLMVYTKVAVLAIISYVLISHSGQGFPDFFAQMAADAKETPALKVLIVASVTFVAYEGFQLVINAVNEMKHPEKNIPRAIYTAIFTVTGIYIFIALAALMTIPLQDIIAHQEYALAAGTAQIIGKVGRDMVITGAVLATSSAISGTVFGASRQLAVIAHDGYMPAFLAKRKPNHIPANAILTMAGMAVFLILTGGLRIILEFGSITFIFVSLLMAVANFKMHRKTKASPLMAVLAIAGLGTAALLIVYYEYHHHPEQLVFIVALYFVLSVSSLLYAYIQRNRKHHRIGS